MKYSWFGSDIKDDNIKNDANKDGYVSLEERSLNAPENRLASTLSFQNLCKGKMFVNLSVRWVEALIYTVEVRSVRQRAKGKGDWCMGE